MNVILESHPGDEIFCIQEFPAYPQGAPSTWETTRMFSIGESVRYISHYRDENLKDQPVCWMVVVEADNGKRYEATQTCFVTAKSWQALVQFFASQSRSKRAKKARGS